MGMSEVDAAHLLVAVALTYLLGFERDLRGAPTGDRVFALVGAGAGVVGIIASNGAPNALAGAITGIGFIGGGLVFRQALGSQQVVTGITNGRRWARYFPDDDNQSMSGCAHARRLPSRQ